MKPADVPAGLIEVAELALGTRCVARPVGSPCDCLSDAQIRTVIAAALTHIEEEEDS